MHSRNQGIGFGTFKGQINLLLIVTKDPFGVI
jgi:hypothetical protein